MKIDAFFDTNILLYLFEEDPRAGRSERLLAKGGVVSVQVLNEFVDVCRRKHRQPLARIIGALSGVRALCEVLPVTLTTHDSAVQLADRYGFRIYDALIAASALEAGCSMLYTEDLQHGQIIEKHLRIVNPFA